MTERTEPPDAPNVPGVALRLPLTVLAGLLAAGAVLLAVAVAYLLASWFEPLAPWMAAVAAAVGMTGAAVPMTVLMLRLAGTSAKEADDDPSTLPAEHAGAETGSTLMREPFMELVAREWSRSRRYGTGAALLIVEIDRYPRLTGALGNDAGERVLAALQQLVAQTLRGADAVARYDAGQLAVFLAHADALGSLDVAERVREAAMKFEVPVAPKRVRFTVSVGVAHLRPSHLQVQALVDDALEAVVAARTAGGNCVRAAPIERSQLPAPGGRPPRGDQHARKG